MRLLLLLALAACSRSDGGVAQKLAANRGMVAHGAPALAPAPGKDYGHAGPATKVTMARGGCAQGCPAFDVAIGGDGTVTWEGHEHVAQPGIRVRHIPPEDLDEVVKTFAAARFDERADVVCRRGGAITTVQLAQAGIAKKVVHEAGCPGEAEMVELENRIEDLAGVREWIAPTPVATAE